MPKSYKKSKFDKYLQLKIKKNMKEWKEGRWVSQKQALAVSYSEARKYKARIQSKKSNQRHRKHKTKQHPKTRNSNKRFYGIGSCKPVTNEEGKFDWPSNNGCVDGTHSMTILHKDKIVDRFGSEGGRFVGEDTETYDDRAIPYYSNTEECQSEYNKTYSNNNPNNDYHTYKVLSDLPVESCQIKPHFGHGRISPDNVQHFLGDDKNVFKLLQDGKICEIQHENRPIPHNFVCPDKPTTFYPPFKSIKDNTVR